MKKTIGMMIVVAIFAIPALIFFQGQRNTEPSVTTLQNTVHDGNQEFKEGTDYFVYPTPIPTSNPAKIEIIDLFWYGCPSCYQVKDALETWREQLGNDFVFMRKPITVRRDWVQHARIWLTAKELGVAEKLHHEIFAAIHEAGNALTTIETMTDFFAQHGVEKTAFIRTFDSSTIQNQLNQLQQEMRIYKPKVTPSLVINGRYLISGTNPQEKMFKIADYLIAKERLAAKQ